MGTAACDLAAETLAVAAIRATESGVSALLVGVGRS
jgi:hypothetical protein